MRPEPLPCAWCGRQSVGRKVRLTAGRRVWDLHLWDCFLRWSEVERALGRVVPGDRVRKEGA